MTKSNLYTVQQNFQNAILNNDPELDFISSPLAIERFSIYQNTVILGLRDVLEATFPSLWYLLPTSNANILAYDYLKSAKNFPSTGVLSEWGDSFPLFVKNDERVNDCDFLYDYMRYEWLKNVCYMAKSVKTFDPHELATLDPELIEKSYFICKPSLYLYASSFPLHEIDQYITTQSHDVSTIKTGPSYCVIIQNKEFYPITYWVKKDFFDFLTSIKDGENLEQIAQKCLNDDESFCFTKNLSLSFDLEIFEKIKFNL